MNRVYRLVWSDSRCAWVPASELSMRRQRRGRVARVAQWLITGSLGLCAFIYYPALHAQSSGDDRLDDLQGLVAKYQAPAAQNPVSAAQGIAVAIDHAAANTAGVPTATITVPHSAHVISVGTPGAISPSGSVASIELAVAPRAAGQATAPGALGNVTATVNAQVLPTNHGQVSSAAVSATVAADRQRPIVQANVAATLNNALNLPANGHG